MGIHIKQLGVTNLRERNVDLCRIRIFLETCPLANYRTHGNETGLPVVSVDLNHLLVLELTSVAIIIQSSFPQHLINFTRTHTRKAVVVTVATKKAILRPIKMLKFLSRTASDGKATLVDIADSGQERSFRIFYSWVNCNEGSSEKGGCYVFLFLFRTYNIIKKKKTELRLTNENFLGSRYA